MGDVWIAQLDRKRVPQARSSRCKSSVTVITAECSRYHASWNVSWPQCWVLSDTRQQSSAK